MYLEIVFIEHQPYGKLQAQRPYSPESITAWRQDRQMSLLRDFMLRDPVSGLFQTFKIVNICNFIHFSIDISEFSKSFLHKYATFDWEH